MLLYVLINTKGMALFKIVLQKHRHVNPHAHAVTRAS